MELIIKIDEKNRTRIGNLHFIPEELKFEVAFAIANGTLIPDNATNGDIIKALFPNEHDFETDFDEEWWNAPYQQGGKE